MITTFKRYSKLLFIALLFTSNVYAQEVITEYSNETLPVLNDELRNNAQDIRTAKSDISTINATLAQAVPSGIIVMWSGSIATIPTGWVLCNGANGTPDLRDRFIVGATADNSGVANTNVTGSLTQSGNGTIPAHTHATQHYEYPDAGSNYGFGVQINSEHNNSNYMGSYGTGTKNIAVYFSLAYIMRQ